MGEKRKKWRVEVWQEWSAWFRIRDFNWSTFTFCNLYVESTRYRGSGCDTFEVHVALLGFNLLANYFYDDMRDGSVARAESARAEWLARNDLGDYGGQS